MKTALILAAVVLAVALAQSSRGPRPSGAPGRFRGLGFKGAKPSPRPITFTEEDKKKFEAAMEEKLSKLSAEAQAAAKQVKAAIEANKDNKEALKKAVEAIEATLSDSVKKELKSLKPNGKGHKEHRGHKGMRRTTIAA